jgi:hypothetical protein
MNSLFPFLLLSLDSLFVDEHRAWFWYWVCSELRSATLFVYGCFWVLSLQHLFFVPIPKREGSLPLLSDLDALSFYTLTSLLVCRHDPLKSWLQDLARNRFASKHTFGSFFNFFRFKHFLNFALSNCLRSSFISYVKAKRLWDSSTKCFPWINLHSLWMRMYFHASAVRKSLMYHIVNSPVEAIVKHGRVWLARFFRCYRVVSRLLKSTVWIILDSFILNGFQLPVFFLEITNFLGCEWPTSLCEVLDYCWEIKLLVLKLRLHSIKDLTEGLNWNAWAALRVTGDRTT